MENALKEQAGENIEDVALCVLSVGDKIGIGKTEDSLTFTSKASTLRAGAGAPKHMSDIKGRLVCQPVWSMDTIKENDIKNTDFIPVVSLYGCFNISFSKKESKQTVYPINLQIVTRYKQLGERTGFGIGKAGDPAYTLEAAHSHGVICLDDQGGKVMSVSVDKVGTLRAEAHGNIPVVLGFSTQASIADNAPVLKEKTPTMRTTTRLGICLCNDENLTVNKNEPILLESNQRHATIRKDGKCTTLPASMGLGGGFVPMICPNDIINPKQTVYGICAFNSNSMLSPNPYSGIYEADTSRTLDCNGGNPACNQGGMVVAYSIAGNTIDRKIENGGNGKGVLKEKSYTLNTIDRHAVCLTNEMKAPTSDHRVVTADGQWLASGKYIFGCLCATCSTKMWLGNQEAFSGDFFILNRKKRVRRLTPLECERLQGLPDFYTLIEDKTCSDAARYKALGNGMAQPCPDWLLKRLVEEVNK